MSENGGPGAAGARPTAPINLEDARERAVDLLTDCFARDVLTLEDFERRVSLAQAAGSMPELGVAIEGLVADVGAESGESQVGSARRPSIATPAEVMASDRAVAVFGETRRAGPWVPARKNTVVAVMGSVEIDLREARLAPGPTVFTILALLGSVEVLVPPGLHVQCSGSAVFGSFEQRDPGHAPATPGHPVIRLDGVSVGGSVEIETRLAGESKRDARRRRRMERRRLGRRRS